MFENATDPFERLEELELITTGQSFALLQIDHQIKENAQITEQIADALQQLSKMNMSLHRQFQTLHNRLTRLEENEKN